ncbi:MAG: glutaredoxin family protein [Burkholderiales bacterium]|jgi:glutaredoxin|nr:glutaredoxin family protein [Burkholderiales bacterium]
MSKNLPIFVLALILSSSAGAAIYRWVDADGRIFYSDSPPKQGGAKSVKIQPNTVAPVAPLPKAKPAAAAGEKVTLYTATWCGYCKKARAYLESRNIPFDDVDVETTDRGRREYREMGGNGVPVIFVGSQRMDGYDQGSLQAMLKAGGW